MCHTVVCMLRRMFCLRVRHTIDGAVLFLCGWFEVMRVGKQLVATASVVFKRERDPVAA